MSHYCISPARSRLFHHLFPPHPIYRCKVHVRWYSSLLFVATQHTTSSSSTQVHHNLPSHKTASPHRRSSRLTLLQPAEPGTQMTCSACYPLTCDNKCSAPILPSEPCVRLASRSRQVGRTLLDFKAVSARWHSSRSDQPARDRKHKCPHA